MTVSSKCSAAACSADRRRKMQQPGESLAISPCVLGIISAGMCTLHDVLVTGHTAPCDEMRYGIHANAEGQIMHDKRRYKRFRLNVREINGKMTLVTEVRIIDISMSGVALKVNKRLNIGSDYKLKLEGKKAISIRCTVVWCSLIETRKVSQEEMIPIYAVGMQFRDMTPEEVAELQNLIENHKIEEVCATGGTRLNIRFHIKDPDNALLMYPGDFKVKVISLSGMLIECSRNFAIESRIPMEMFIHDDSPITFVGRVASCREIAIEGRKQYDIGIAFLELTERDREALTSFIDHCAMPHSETESDPEMTAGTSSDEDMPVISQEFVDKVEHLYRWHTTMGYYKILDIDEYATDEQIRNAFFERTHELHPERYPAAPEDVKQKLKILFYYLNAARSTLLDPRKRKEYDKLPITRLRH
jgi:hypothetical protein